MNKLKLLTLVLGIGLITLGAGCSSDEEIALDQPQSDGGVYKSTDRGKTWSQKVFVRDLEDGLKEFIDTIEVKEMIFDPLDSETIYLVAGNGLFVTINGAEQWIPLSGVRIDAFALDPKRRGTLYIGSQDKIHKTTDAGLNWPEVYRETRSGVTITDIDVDPEFTNVVWASNSAGEVLKSNDNGLSWKVVRSFGNKVNQIVLEPGGTGVMYAATDIAGIFRSTDGGANWENLLDLYLNKLEAQTPGATPVEVRREKVWVHVKITLDPTRKERLYYLSQYGILRSSDRGNTWEELQLVTVPGSVALFDLAINPRDSREILYSSERVLYHSRNFGSEWFTEPVPTDRRLKAILIHPSNPSILYAGTEAVPPPPSKKRGLFF